MPEYPKDKKTDADTDADKVDFHGAAVVDEDGRETEITESMVRKAIRALEPDIDAEVDAENSDQK